MDELTYDDIIRNWGVLERHIIKTQFGASKEHVVYDHLAIKVYEWLFSDAVLEQVPTLILDHLVTRQDSIRDLLTNRHIVPGSPILEHAGTEVSDSTNYFSYYNIEKFPTFLGISHYAKPGTEIGYQPLLSDESDEGIQTLFDNTDNSNLSFTLREDGSLFNRFINTKGGTPQRNFVYYHEFEHAEKFSRAMNQAKYLGITFAQNIKRNSIISHVISPYYSTSQPGYMGPNNTACPMFYINAEQIIAESGEFEVYLSKVNLAAFCATLLANVVLYQTDGYLTSNVIENTIKHRPVGVGIMGLHAAMIRCDVPYESEIGLTFASQTQSSLTLGTMAASSMIMVKATKAERVGQNSPKIGELLRRCTDELSGMEIVLQQLESIGTALSEHGCMYNLTSTVQGYDPNLAGLLGISTEGIEPLIEIEMCRSVGDDGETVIVFPREIFNGTHAMTCDLSRLREQTFPYISTAHKLKMIRTIQDLSHSPVAANLVFPADANDHALSTSMNDAHMEGLYHLKMYKGNYSLQKRTYNEIIEPEPVLEVETIEVPEKSDNEPLQIPSYFGQEELSEEEFVEVGDISPVETNIEPSIEVADAKVYKITSPNLLLHLTITDDGKYVNVDAPSNGHATSFSISEALSQLTLSGRTNDGKNTTGD